MNRWKIVGWIMGCLFGLLSRVDGQSFEVQQLLLDVQKLSQEKELLNDLYKGYDILSKGYGAIRDISKGSFDLHKAFLDGLLTVSPQVKQYKRVANIINLQGQMVVFYRSAWARFRQDGHLTPDEIVLIGNLYSGLLDQSVKALDALTMVLTDGRLRADDGERIRQIDALYKGTHDRWVSMQALNDQAAQLSRQRAAEAAEVGRLKQVYGLTK